MENQQQTWEDWATETFVGDNYYYYKVKWEHQKPNRSFISWNWSAFFFPYFWMAFRKMYIYAFIVIILSLLSYSIPPLGIIFHVITGAYANYLYYNKCNIAVETASKYCNKDAITYLKKQGGTSRNSLVLSIVIIVSVASIFLTGFYAFYKYSDSKQATSVESTLSSAETTNAKEKTTFEVITKGGEITYRVPKEYEQAEPKNSDLLLNSTYHGISLISFVYRQEDFDEIVNEQYFIQEVTRQYNEIYTLVPVTDTDLPDLDSEASQALYSSTDKGIINYFYLTCEKIDNYYVLSISVSNPIGWLKYKNDIVEIFSSAALNMNDKIY